MKPSLSSIMPRFRRLASLLAVAGGFAASAGAEPLPTMRPDGTPPPPPPEYAARPFSLAVQPQPRVPRPLDFEPGLPSPGRVAVIVENGLYASVTNKVATFAADLTAHGFTPFVVTFSGTAEQLKAALSGYYGEPASLKGAVLIGDLPYAVWEMFKSFDSSSSYYAAEICDIFLMDLDGVWEDLNDEPPYAVGRYDTRGGDLHCEIWVTRIAAGNLSISGQTEASLVNGYINRNHAYRSGATSVAKTALHYTDNDWSDDATDDVRELGAVYQTVVSRSCGVDAGAGGADYRDNHLPSNVELIQVRCHGTATTHMWDDSVNVTSSDYLVKDPDAVFYNLYTCSGADFTTANNLSRIAIMNPEAGGLAAWSHSGTGGMITFDRYRASVFYDALGSGECLGEAFRLWYNSCVDGDTFTTEPYWKTPKWFNGMRVDGDGCLTLRTPIIRYVSTTGSDTPPYTSWADAARSVNDAFALCGPGDIILIAEGYYPLSSTLVFDSSKAIRLSGTGTNATAVLDSQGGRCVTVNSGVQAVIENVALTGGSADYGGGVHLSGGVLRGCVVSNNAATYAGGGIYFGGPALVEQCLVAGNTSARHGGGFIAWHKEAVMRDTVVSNNVAGEGGGGGITTDGGRYERCIFVGNTAGTVAGALYMIASATALDACAISGNHAAQDGGGVYMYRGSIRNTLVAGNTCGGDGGGVGGETIYTPGITLTNVTIASNEADGAGDGVWMGSNFDMLNCIVWGNGSDDLHVVGSTGVKISHSCLGEAYAGTGDNNIFANPLLTADFRLAAGSPCLEAGFTPEWMIGTSDLAGYPRILPQGANADIGAYEYLGSIGLFAAPGALNFTAYETYDPAVQSLALRSDRSAAVNAACVASAGWLTVSPGLTAGGAVTDSASVTGFVGCAVTGLSPGHFSAAVEIRTNGAVHAFDVPVTLDVLPLQTDALAFGPVASPQGTGVAFTVSLAARNAAGFTNRHHAADVALKAFAFNSYGETDQVGTDTTTTEYFLYTYYHDSRSQMVFLSSELGGAGVITNIAFYLTQRPGVLPLNAFTVRFKHTSESSFSFGAVFETAGWHTGYSASLNLTSGQVDTWVNLPIDPPFVYGGTSNLMVDISFNNSKYSNTRGYVRRTLTGSISRHYHGYSDSSAGDPLLWSGTSGGPSRSTRTERPNLRFDFVRETEVVIPTRPATLAGSSFSQGVWQGGVAIDAVRSNVMLRATLGALTALSNPLDVLVYVEPTSPIPSAWLAQFGLPPDADPEGNPDNDPFTTLQEYVADTNPTNSASFLRVTAISSGPPVTVSFTPASTARDYTLQSTTNLVTGPWLDVPGQGPRPGAGGGDAMSDDTEAPVRFYRVKVEVP